MTATTRVATMVGGVIGIVVTVIWILVGAAASGGDNSVEGWLLGGFAAFALAVVGIVAGRIVDASAGWSTLLLLAAGVGGFFAVSIGWLLTGPLFLAASVTAFVAWLRQRRKSPAASVEGAGDRSAASGSG